MRLVPRNQLPRLEFFKSRLAKWLEHAEQIGSSVEEIEALAEKVEAARVKLQAKQMAQNAARSATLAFNNAMDEVANAGAAVIERARATARLDGAGVYSLALISPPEKGSPIAPPGTPQSFKAELDGIGGLILTWKCKNPRGSSGTMYHVSRQLGGAGPFEFLASVGEKRFIDDTLPTGHSFVMYRIRAMRSTGAGAANTFSVEFGGAPRMPKTFSAAA